MSYSRFSCCGCFRIPTFSFSFALRCIVLFLNRAGFDNLKHGTFSLYFTNHIWAIYFVNVIKLSKDPSRLHLLNAEKCEPEET